MSLFLHFGMKMVSSTMGFFKPPKQQTIYKTKIRPEHLKYTRKSIPKVNLCTTSFCLQSSYQDEGDHNQMKRYSKLKICLFRFIYFFFFKKHFSRKYLWLPKHIFEHKHGSPAPPYNICMTYHKY